jgi:hypothetical protein
MLGVFLILWSVVDTACLCGELGIRYSEEEIHTGTMSACTAETVLFLAFSAIIYAATAVFAYQQIPIQYSVATAAIATLFISYGIIRYCSGGHRYRMGTGVP